MAELSWRGGEAGEHVHRQLRLLVHLRGSGGAPGAPHLVQPDGLVQLRLGLDDAGVPLLIHPPGEELQLLTPQAELHATLVRAQLSG